MSVEFRAKPSPRKMFNFGCSDTLVIDLPEGVSGAREYQVTLSIIELHPRNCPICESKTELGRDEFEHFVRCTNPTCNTIGPRRPGDMSAVAAWNGEE